MDTHCHFREAVQDGLVGRVFFFFLFYLFSLRVLHVYQRCGHLLFFRRTYYVLFFLFCLSNAGTYRARR
jgi:hypothetical protein